MARATDAGGRFDPYWFWTLDHETQVQLLAYYRVKYGPAPKAPRSRVATADDRGGPRRNPDAEAFFAGGG